jgi:hypothetical protein
VLCEKKILNETKNHNPPLRVKWSVPYLSLEFFTFRYKLKFYSAIRSDIISNPKKETVDRLVNYEKKQADIATVPKAPSYSHQFRRSGTILWAQPGKYISDLLHKHA